MSRPKKEQQAEPDFSILEERFGKGVLVSASDRKKEEVKEWASSGSLTLDMATGGPGIPKNGKCTCILGKEGSSKTTLALHIIAEEHKKNKKSLCCFLDAEDSLDLSYAEKIGVDLSRLFLVDRESLLKELGVKDREIISGEEWLEFTCNVLKSNIYEIVILDSVAALIPMAEVSQGILGGRLAGVASMMAKAYRAVNAALTIYNGAFIYLNQYRMNPGGYVPLVEPGGEAWKYLQSLKIEISKSVDKDTDGAYGIVVKGKITKSKVGIPFRTFEYYVKFGYGILQEKEVLDLCIEMGKIKKSGSWYSDGESKLGQGEDSVLEVFKDNREYYEKIKQEVLEDKMKILQV